MSSDLPHKSGDQDSPAPKLHFRCVSELSTEGELQGPIVKAEIAVLCGVHLQPVCRQNCINGVRVEKCNQEDSLSVFVFILCVVCLPTCDTHGKLKGKLEESVVSSTMVLQV